MQLGEGGVGLSQGQSATTRCALCSKLLLTQLLSSPTLIMLTYANFHDSHIGI